MLLAGQTEPAVPHRADEATLGPEADQPLAVEHRQLPTTACGFAARLEPIIRTLSPVFGGEGRVRGSEV